MTLSLCSRLTPVLVIIAITLLACERTFDEGEFHGLKIGSTKKQVLDILVRADNVTHIHPTVAFEVTVDQASIENMDLLYAADGIGLRGSRSEFPTIGAQIEFADDRVSKLTFFPPKNPDHFGLELGQTKSQVLERLENVIRSEPLFRVGKFVVGHRWVKLDEMTEKDIAYLARHDTWRYKEKHEYSNTTLWFSDNTLVRISYWWSPIELP